MWKLTLSPSDEKEGARGEDGLKGALDKESRDPPGLFTMREIEVTVLLDGLKSSTSQKLDQQLLELPRGAHQEHLHCYPRARRSPRNSLSCGAEVQEG